MRKLKRTRENPPRKAETSGAARLGAARGSPRTKHSLLPFPVTTPLWTRPVGSIPEIYYHPPDHRGGQYLTLLRVRPGMCWCRILQPRGEEGGGRGTGRLMSRQEGIRQLPRSQARCGFQHLAWDRGWDVAWSTPGELSSSREVGGEAEAGRRRVTGVPHEHTPGLGRAKGPSTAPHTAELALPCCKGAGLPGPGLSGHRQPRP